MSDDADRADERKSGFFTELPLAISFLTILPVIDQRPASEDTVAASFAWFPIVGFLLGVALSARIWILAHVFAQVIRSVLIVLSLTVSPAQFISTDWPTRPTRSAQDAIAIARSTFCATAASARSARARSSST